MDLFSKYYCRKCYACGVVLYVHHGLAPDTLTCFKCARVGYHQAFPKNADMNVFFSESVRLIIKIESMFADPVDLGL